MGDKLDAEKMKKYAWLRPKIVAQIEFNDPRGQKTLRD
jgi:hypothetical protein